MMKDAAEAPTKTSHMQQIIAVLRRGLAGRQPDRGRVWAQDRSAAAQAMWKH